MCIVISLVKGVISVRRKPTILSNCRMFATRDDWKICGIIDGIFVNKWLSFRFRILRIWSLEMRNMMGIGPIWGSTSLTP